MDEVGKPSGLTRRSGSAVWYFRQRCPQRHRKPGTPAEIWISLGTAIYPEALARMDDARQEAQRRFATREPHHSLTGIFSRTVRPSWPDESADRKLQIADAALLAQDFYRRAVQEIDLEPRPSGWEDFRVDAYRDELRDRYSRFAGVETDDEIDDVEGAMVSVLRQAKLSAEPMDEATLLLRQYLRRALAQTAAIRLARFDGDYSDNVSDAMFRIGWDRPQTGVFQPAEPPQAKRQTKLKTTLVDRWAAERGVTQKGIDKHRAAAHWFVERTNVQDVEEVTKAGVLLFKDRMIGEAVSPANANAKLSCLRTLLGYAVQNSLIEANPAQGVRVLDKDKDRRKRREFDLASLNSIFDSPVYSADERPKQGRGEAAYWLPLMALFTGARLEELAQLRSTDVLLERYLDDADREQTAWMIAVVQEDGLSTKNAGSDRRIPVHPDLERLGLIRMAQAAVAAGQRFLFPDLPGDIYGKRGGKWGEWWSRYRRFVCGVSDRRLVFHSFRHSFKFYARHVGMVEGVQRQIMGHSPGDVAAEYGGGRYSTYQLVEGMKLYRIPGLSLPPPPPAYRS